MQIGPLQVIRDGNGLDALRRKPGVTGAELNGGMTVRDILALDGFPEDASLAHKNSVFLVPVEDRKLLTDVGREDFAALLDALTELYVALAPRETRQEISARIKEELAAREAEMEESRKCAVFHVRENGGEEYFRLG